MVFLVIFGPPAVGKMTVGFELSKLTGFKVFHNHLSIEPVLNFFDFGTPQFGRLVSGFRQSVFEEVAASDLPGLIFTYVWSLDQNADKDYVDRNCEIFRKAGARICFAELQAALPQRLERNASELRLSHKPSKRDVEKSKERLLEHDKTNKFNSSDDFFYAENYVKIDNTHLSPAEAASQICSALGFVRV
jgi:hypothetical protein